jgi:hypothetical protein
VADKLEVLAGPGLVVRYNEVAAWAGPQATAALQAHLVTEAQRTSRSANGGDQLASSLIAVLQRGDPEPQAPFAVVGPGANGLTLFLHGPVQAWDSGRWLAPQPVPGWMVTSIGRPWPLIILPYGASPPPQSQQGNPFDLVIGAVPGSGFVLLRPPTGQAQPAGAQPAATTPQAAQAAQAAQGDYRAPGAAPAGVGVVAAGGAGAASGPAPAMPATEGAAGTGAMMGAAAAGGAALGAIGEAAARGAGGTEPGPGGAASGVPSVTGGAAMAAAPGTASPSAVTSPSVVSPVLVAPTTETPGQGQGGERIDLRNSFTAGQPPLTLASAWAVSRLPDAPDVPGVRCELGHFNHPRVTTCLRCGRPVLPGSPELNGPRPPVGVLLVDDGSIWSLRRLCLIGSEPGSAPEVQSGSADGITLRSGPNHAMAPVHAELQIRLWSTYLVDRGAEGGTWVQVPGAAAWAQLGRSEQRELPNGSHVSCGGRVLTYLSDWPE